MFIIINIYKMIVSIFILVEQIFVFHPIKFKIIVLFSLGFDSNYSSLDAITNIVRDTECTEDV